MLEKLNPLFDLAGRIFIAILFVPAGISKITGYSGTAGYMESVGVPGILLPLVILVELGGGLAILAGWQTRIVAFLLAGFCLVSALIFHYQPAEQMQMILFMKNIAIAGGLLFLVANGAGAYSLDARLKKD
ncbi:DoxX family membrane protein [Sneathiella chungangensis]|uniref:DoxX family membrane protein n=1 Tax=Sneathiella chungangensis TaxID=1418234 RepID=A0A845MFA0_9PROT|nr:DoxX family membrane protein [Sneathiella chungangensis]